MEFKEEVQIDISENQELEFPQSHQEVTICQEDDDVTAEALMTLHNSVQNIQTQNILYQVNTKLQFIRKITLLISYLIVFPFAKHINISIRVNID